jgi:hypothetical protein
MQSDVLSCCVVLFGVKMVEPFFITSQFSVRSHCLQQHVTEANVMISMHALLCSIISSQGTQQQQFW